MPANQLSLKLGEDTDLELHSMHGHEEMSKPFEFELDVTSPRDLADLRKLAVTAEVTFTHANGETRVFHGLVVRCTRALDHASAGTFRYTLTVVPWFTFLRFNQDCRIFQGMNVIDIFKEVVGAHGFADYDLANVPGHWPTLDYCVQYRESDFDFLSRLLEENGIVYFFRHAAGKHTMALGAGSLLYDKSVGEDLVFSRATSTETVVSSWSQSYRYVTGKTVVREYDAGAPQQPREEKWDSELKLKNADKFSVYDYTGRFEMAGGNGIDALLRMEIDEAAYDVARGSGNVTHLAVGRRFSIGDSFAGPEDALPERNFACTSIDHDLEAATGYSCSFTAIPAAETFRAQRSTPRAVVRGPQTATVVGPSGEEIYTDELGRIKVQFHWDRLGKHDDKSSCFVRVAQPLAGKNFGFQFLPRIGQEVVVQFLEGDPDRPLVTGSVYNSQVEPPYVLPDDKTRSGIRTRSSKDGGADNFNEIRFEDKKGAEELSVQAEKNMKRVVKSDDTVQVGNDQTITVANNRTITVQKGDQHITVEKGSHITEVSEGDEVTVIAKGDRSEILSEGDELVRIYKGSRVVQISEGSDTLSITQGDQSISIDSGTCAISALNGIEFAVGQNSIKIDQSGITIKGMLINIEGQIQTNVKGLLLNLTSDAMAIVKGGITMIG